MLYEPAHDWSAVDRALGLPDDAALVRLAERIDAIHRGQRDPTGAWRTRQHRLIGLWGERHVARVFRLPMDLTIRPSGSARQNFRLADGTTVDVITRSPLPSGAWPDLTRPLGRRGRVDVLVLVVFLGFAFEPQIAGWIEEAVLLAEGERREFRPGLACACLPVGRLHPLWSLLARHRPDDPLAQPPPAPPAPAAGEAAAPAGTGVTQLALAWEAGPQEVRHDAARDE